MRLACPNCDAKYEVPDDAIPEAGRDVQCSNCGHTWFQMHPAAEEAAEAEADLYGDDLPPEEAHQLEAAPEPAMAAVPEPAPEPAPSPAATRPAPAPLSDDDLGAALAAALADPAPEAGPAVPPAAQPAEPVAPPAAAFFPEEDDDEGPAAAPPGTAPKRELDEAVLNVLREEAEREAEARRAEARLEAQRAETRRADAEGQMQVQPDLGMEEATPADRPGLTATQRRLAMLRGENPDAPPPELPRPAARRDLLPDVEEINSTLQPGDDGPDADAMVDSLPDLTKSRLGFRTGFLLMIFLLIVAAVVYVAAPSLSAAIPALQEPLAAYVTFVDGLRLWLDEAMNRATQALTSKTGG
jgi:predicted Zn finger-like uncharacterized protein